MAFIQLKNTGIDSEWVDINAISFVPGYRKLNNTRPLSGQVDSTTSFVIAKADRAGIENPVFIIEGVINLDDLETNANLWRQVPSTATAVTDSTGASMQSAATLGFLLRLITYAAGQLYLKIRFGDPASQVNWVKIDHSDPPVSADTEIPVEIDSFSPVPDVTSDGLHIIRYSLTLREVRV